MPRMTGSRYFAEFMRGYGVTHVFFVPTVAMNALGEMEDLNIRRVLTHGEVAAAYMADGYARASGKPGVCMAQNVGASNLMAGLRDAYMACSPVIAISGGPSTASRYRHAYQDVDDCSQFDPVTKFNARVDDVTRLPDLLRQAFREATSGSPGPVHLQIREPYCTSIEAEGEFELVVEEQFTHVPPFRPEPTEIERVRAAAAMLHRAHKPIIVAGGGVTASGAQREVVELAEKLCIPVITSLNAKQTILDTHPLSVGVAGTYSRSCANRVLAEADTVFFIGSRTGGMITTNWQIPARGTTVIQLDINSAELGRNYSCAVALLGDAAVTLRRLIDLAQPKAPEAAAAWTGRVGQLVSEWRKGAEVMRNSDAVPMRPERICKEISEALPANGVVVADTGHAGMWSAQMIDFTQPGQRLIRCAGSLGWGFPGSLGVKCALPDRPVLCFTGDGGIYYYLSELETAARCGINVVVVVNNNSALNQELRLVNRAYGGKQRGRAGDIWRFQNLDLAKVAESLGCVGLRARTPEEFKKSLRSAFGMNKPVVIDAVTDVEALATRAWVPG